MAEPRVRAYGDAANRWAGVGPYYAMFPVAFADDVVESHTRPGEMVLDPFAGRGTGVFSAAARGRVGIGIEIGPVGYVYGQAKLSPSSFDNVDRRLRWLGSQAPNFETEADALPLFFQHCYSPGVRRFLLAARSHLNWRRSPTDRTLMAILLVYLHGKVGAALSNQMRQTKALSPGYAVRWWSARGLDPPDLDPVQFIRSRLRWRYAKGVVEPNGSQVLLGDSRERLKYLKRVVDRGTLPRASLIFTSPPYYAVTNYDYDQWLRLWLLGGKPNALLEPTGRGGKFESRLRYQSLLNSVFEAASAVACADATVYVRTDARPFTRDATIEALRRSFPAKLLEEVPRPLNGGSQTRLFLRQGSGSPTSGEVDLILRPG